MRPTRKLTFELDEEQARYLEVLAHSDHVCRGGVIEVLRYLAHSAADGVRRPGAWERAWVEQCFGDGWQEDLERDPDSEWQMRPKAQGSDGKAQS